MSARKTRERTTVAIDPKNPDDPQLDLELESDDENRFSQDDDDHAGRSWHVLKSNVEVDEVSLVPAGDDEKEEALPRPGRLERV